MQLEDVAKLFEDRFSVQMLAQLERHILQLNNFRVNVATPLDFCLHFAFLEKVNFPMTHDDDNDWLSGPIQDSILHDILIMLSITIMIFVVIQAPTRGSA